MKAVFGIAAKRIGVKVCSGLGVLCTTGVAVAAGCPPVEDSIWQSAMDKARAEIGLAVTAMTDAVAIARTVNLARMQSAIRVVTKQIEVSGEKQAAAEVAAKQAGASFQVELANRRAVLETAMQYNAATGQGFDPCGESERSRNVAVAIGEASTNMPDRVMREIDASPGRLVQDRAAVVAQRLSRAQSIYGQGGALEGKDVDAGHFFKTYQLGTPEGHAKSALLDNLYGVPFQAPNAADVNTPAGRSFFESKRAMDAIRSMSQTIMKTVQSWTESRPGGNSVIDAIAIKVGTYAGGANYTDWEAKKATESEHGLLVDLAKMRAFELYMRNIEYQQLELQEAALASLLALRTSHRGDPANAWRGNQQSSRAP